MRLAGVVCLLLSACSFEHGQLGGVMRDGSVGGDDAADARPIDSPDGCVSFSTQLDTCSQLMQGNPLDLSGTNTYNTDDFSLTTPAGPVDLPHTVVTTADGDLVVVFVSTLSLASGATLRVDATSMRRPLGIIATGAVTIGGLIDLTDNAAGARTDATCATLGLKGLRGMDNNGGASGGGGGAFAGNGGHGSDGDSDGVGSTGANGGVAVTAKPAHVVGGCDGGGGGDGMSINGGRGGHGGGAILITSAVSITISTGGGINAGGGGGVAGNGNGGGGGGGGSGGMIVLESGSVTINGKLAANGGGGGEGADGNQGNNGTTGLLSTSRASGGSGNAGEGGDGAGGGAGTNADGQNATQLKKGGGGGGGGAVGFIAIGPATPTMSGATISPAYRAWP